MQKNRDRPLTKNGYVKQDVLKAISGFFIILAIMAAISMFAGIGKGNGGNSSNGGGNTSSGIVGDTTTGNNGSVELPEEELAGVWLLNDTIEWIGEEKTFNVDLFYDGASYSSVIFSSLIQTDPIIDKGDFMSFDDTTVYHWLGSGSSGYIPGWQNLECKTVIVSSTLASVENGAELLAYLKANGTKQSISESSFITFTIEGVTYYAEAGMTWTDWCDSVYNVNDAYTSGAGVYKTGTLFDYVSKTGAISDVLGTDQILANYDYKIFQKLASGDVEEPEEEDELQGTWVLNSTINRSSEITGNTYFDVKGTYNGCLPDTGVFTEDLSFSRIMLGSGVSYEFMIFGDDTYYAEDFEDDRNINNGYYYNEYKSGYYVSCVYQDGQNNAYDFGSENGLTARTFSITSKLSEVENGDVLLAYLKANATKQSTTATTLITFTIGNTTFQAEEGMTWAEWVDSEYNTGGYKDGTDYVYFDWDDGENGSFITTDGGIGGQVKPTETIIADFNYQLRDFQ